MLTSREILYEKYRNLQKEFKKIKYDSAAKQMGARYLKDAGDCLMKENFVRAAELVGNAEYHLPYAQAYDDRDQFQRNEFV